MTISNGRESILAATVIRLRRRPFDWKTFNCALAAAEIARPYADIDFPAIDKLRDKCKGKLSALRIIKQAGGLDKIVDGLGLERIEVSYARRGDCLMFGEELAEQTLGINYDGALAVVPGETQLGFMRVLDAKAAWKVR